MQNKRIIWTSKIKRTKDETRIIKDLSVALELSEACTAILASRGYDTEEAALSFLSKKTELLHDPFLMEDMEKASVRIIDAVKSNEKITIYGDYDVDGVTSVSTLYLYLNSIGANVDFYIPCRSGEGYGVSEQAVKKIHDTGTSLIITVDTGITAVKETEFARQLGIDIIITDHHECNQILPDAYSLVNPRIPGSAYPFKELAGVGVVFKLLCALECLRSDDKKMINAVRRIAADYIDLVAIGTIADVMPVKDENRLIISKGLSMIKTTQRPGIIELIEASGSDANANSKKKITSGFIGYTIAPRINAAGRISSASIAVDLFLSKNRSEAEPIAKKLCDINRERQNVENLMIESANHKLLNEFDMENEPAIVLSDENWHHGIIGIVSSRITEKYNRPSILISFEGNESGKISDDDIGKGSGRSVKGINLVDALSFCSEFLIKYGGHELAAGLTIERRNYNLFKEKINEYCRKCLAENESDDIKEADLELREDEITMEFAKQLYLLEPYGVDNPVPVFLLKDIEIVDITPVGAGKHTRITVRCDSRDITAMCFRQNHSELDLYPGDRVDIMFNLDINEFQNRENIQFVVRDIRLSDNAYNDERHFHNIYYEIKQYIESDSIIESKNIDSYKIHIPVKRDFAEVYNYIKQETKIGHEVFSIRAILFFIKKKYPDINYVKLRFIIEVLSDLDLISAEVLDSEREIFAFGCEKREKTSLMNSKIFCKLTELNEL